MHIVHYFPRLRKSDGGTYYAIVDWCSLLSRHGHVVTLVTRTPDDPPAEWEAIGSPTIAALPKGTLGPILGRRELEAATGVVRGADVLHLHSTLHPSNLQLARVAKQMRIPYVVTTHGMLDDWSMGQKRLKKETYHAVFGRRFLQNAAVVHCTAEAERDQVRKRYDEVARPAFVAPCIVDLEPFRRTTDPELAKMQLDLGALPTPRILFLSRVHYKKRAEALIDAVGALRDRAIVCSLVIAGPGDPPYLETLKTRAEHRGLHNIVRFVGRVEGDTKTSLFRLADLFVLPTSQENFGIVFIESLASGTAIVTTRGVDIWRELEQSGGAVILSEISELCTVLTELLPDRHRREAMGEAGRRWALESFSDRVLIARANELYATAIDRS